MKTLSETAGLERLHQLKSKFRALIIERYEHKARPCSLCPTRGICCQDAHFVNVRISRLEAVAIRRTLERLPDDHRHEVYRRLDDSIATFRLDSESGGKSKTFACPLFEPKTECLVHETAKPLPCIHYACYDKREDIPPDELLDEAEISLERLNRRVYGRQQALLPLPVAIQRVAE